MLTMCTRSSDGAGAESSLADLWTWEPEFKAQDVLACLVNDRRDTLQRVLKHVNAVQAFVQPVAVDLSS